MALNGSVQITRGSNSTYTLTYAPLGADPGERPARRFEGAQELEQFLAGPLRVARARSWPRSSRWIATAAI
jgi:hypothetical protein